ncbi:head-tail connector protein [Limosilactobacillus reuteri]|uniref:head-tail connector protein n=1 Tax=Limosilactobacillus reuteri TaxID=1598 RepID=UPI001E3A5B81|nr:head-tail connector protein [Limosilactobacillus reuteri]MCC4440433.1 head-tail connector protein [Limosilactobacillus reuteri]
MKFDVEQWEVDNFKQALYLDGEEEDQLIKDYLKNAKAYVQNAVSPTEDLTKYDQYTFAVQMLAQFWYQNRGIDMAKTPYQVVSMIQQLRGLV